MTDSVLARTNERVRAKKMGLANPIFVDIARLMAMLVSEDKQRSVDLQVHPGGGTSAI